MGKKERASWHHDYEKGFVEILQDYVHVPRFRGQNGWKSEGWNSIMQKFNEKFPSAGYDKLQLQDKEKDLKLSYKAIRDARKNSGAGWNDQLCMINASDEEWETKHKDNHILKKFRRKAFPLYYDMEKLCEGSIATGDLNFTSTSESLGPLPSETQKLDDPPVGINPFSTNLEKQGALDDPINLDVEENTTSSCSGRKETNSGKKRKQSQVAEVLQEYVDFRKRQTIAFQEELNKTTKPNEDYSIKNCLSLLESMEELSDIEKVRATKILKCEQNREIFLSFKSPTIRLLWLRGEIAP